MLGNDVGNTVPESPHRFVIEVEWQPIPKPPVAGAFRRPLLRDLGRSGASCPWAWCSPQRDRCLESLPTRQRLEAFPEQLARRGDSLAAGGMSALSKLSRSVAA